MPELPEVEIHARNLRRWLLGKVIADCRVLDPLVVAFGEPGFLAATVQDRRVLSIRRLAKYLLIDLEGGHTLVAHLRMTGRFVFDGYATGPVEKPTRLVMDLEEGGTPAGRVRFEDRRRFGRVGLERTENVHLLPGLSELGPDALVEPTSAARLREIMVGARRSIKAVLMDQRVIGGLGNICAIEILYRAGIAPETPAGALGEDQVREIASIIPSYLEWAIDAQSRRELIYLGEKGAENVFTIYRREGSPCPKCGSPIARMKVAGRGTYFCPGCQR
jgi:formamidopyrimidine-DNA glycosylase